VFTTIPQGAQVTLETGAMTTTPNEMANVSLGRHIANISINGRHILTDTINVSETNVRFPEGKGFYDLRKKKSITFESEPDHAILTLDNHAIGTAPMTIDVPYGSHNIIAAAGDVDKDTLTFNVSHDSPTKYLLNPVKKQRFEAVAYYHGERVAGTLRINGRQFSSEAQTSYSLSLPTDRTYAMEMFYNGYTTKRDVKVNSRMDPIQRFDIYAKKEMVMPWEKEYDTFLGGISLGFVSKSYTPKGNNDMMIDTSLDGVQLGVHFEPVFRWGLGLYTGLFYEFYSGGPSNGPEFSFTEQDLYVPVHAYYRLPLSKKFLLAAHAGLGMDITLSRSNDDDDEYSYGPFDDSNTKFFSRKFNLDAEIAIDVRYGPVSLTIGYSRGLLSDKLTTNMTSQNQGYYDDYYGYGYGEQNLTPVTYETTQSKLTLTLSWLFGR